MNTIRTTKSVCPECLSVIDAELFVREGKVMIRKECHRHGMYEDVYWEDYDQYQRAMKYRRKGLKLENPRTKTLKGCPLDCGICPEHKSHTVLAIIDLTNRCNLNCPVCFANANNPTVSHIYEATRLQVEQTIDNIASNRPVPPNSLQFSGGEPTLRDDLPDLIRYARSKGMDHIEVNTNGLRLARDLEYFKNIFEAGTNTIYLAFEGVTRAPYIKTKGLDLLDLKQSVLENARKIGFDSFMLVPTIARGVNDDQLGDIIRFAAKNRDIVSGVNGQPISLAGRVSSEERRRMRITIPEVTKLIEKQTDGQIRQSDFYPVPFVYPIFRAVGAIKRRRYPDFSCHPACGVGTFVFVEDDRLVPINRFMNVERFIQSLAKVSEYADAGKYLRAKMQLLASLRHVNSGLLKDLISSLYKEGSYDALSKVMKNFIMVGMMHFMDAYNFDLERAQMCVIHYAVPDGRLIPFCTYNTIHRSAVETKLGIPKSQVNQVVQAMTPPV